METDFGEDITVTVFLWTNVNLKMVGCVYDDDLNRELGVVQRDHIVCQTFWRAVVSSTQPPVVHGEKTGDGATEAAEGDAVLAELHHQRGNLGGGRDILGDILVREWQDGGSSSDTLSSLS